MRARDVMTTPVHTVTSSTSVIDVARLLGERRIGGVPVVDAGGRIVGIVSESDLMRRPEIGTERRRSWLARFLAEPETLAADYVRAQGTTAETVMTRNVVTAAPETPLAEVAETMERRAIKRLPVVDHGRLVGIVSRADLVRAIVAHGAPAAAKEPQRQADDAALREQLLETLRRQPWAGGPTFNVMVEDGVVHIWGFVRSEDERRAVAVAAGSLPGVRGVENRLTIAHWDIGI